MNFRTNEFNENIDRLNKFIPVVSRVHGAHHPEFKEVEKEYYIITQKLNNNDSNISGELNKIVKITNNFTIPDGVCESYEAVYAMLKNIKNLYNTYK